MPTGDEDVLVDTYFARQPILDRRGALCAYELLFRGGPHHTAAPPDPIGATATVLANAFSDTKDAGSDGAVLSFVNLPRALIVSRSITVFPSDAVGVEVLEDVEPDREVIDALADLRAAGYTVALDDWVENDHRGPLLAVADIVKVDVGAVPPARLPAVVADLSARSVELLAEKVETATDFERCTELGFTAFQGFYFARPMLVAGKRLDEGRARLAELLSDLYRPGLDIDDVAAAVGRHPEFSLKLLRLLNSAMYGLSRGVESIRDAVVMLGIRKITELATILALAANDHKPRQLVALALTRAQMCSLVAAQIGRDDQASCFTVGLLSILDAVLDQPMREVMAHVALADEVKRALVERAGAKGRLLDTVIAWERGDWKCLDDSQFDPRVLSSAYFDALVWSGRLLQRV